MYYHRFRASFGSAMMMPVLILSRGYVGAVLTKLVHGILQEGSPPFSGIIGTEEDPVIILIILYSHYYRVGGST